MLSKLISFVKQHQEEIILFSGVILISLFSFAVGYITSHSEQQKEVIIEKNINHEQQ